MTAGMGEAPPASGAPGYVGYRGRPPEPPGEDLGRIIALSDGVFAFALTLLALSLAVPALNTSGETPGQVSRALSGALGADWNGFVGYVFAFVMIAIWWTVHHRTFRYLRRYDTRLIWLNMAVLIEVAIMPFVLSVYRVYSNTPVAVDLFAGTQAATGATLATIWTYATSHRRLVDPSLDPRIISYYRVRGWVAPAIFALSIGVAQVSTLGAELTWLLLIVAQRLSGRYGS